MKQSVKKVILEKLNTAIIKMDELGAWDFDAKVKQVLGKLNIHHLHQTVRYIKRWSTKKSGTGKNVN